MARPTKQRARIEWVCGKSGRTILKGEEYWRLERAFRKPQIRALEHPFKRSETTGSEYLSRVWDLIDGLYLPDDLEALEGIKDDLVAELEGLKDELEDNLNNMPDHLQDTSDSGILLSERIEALESAIDDLEDLDFDFDYEGDYDEDDEEYEDDYQEEIDSFVDELKDQITDALDQLDV